MSVTTEMLDYKIEKSSAFWPETRIKQLTRINQSRSKWGDRCKIVDAWWAKKVYLLAGVRSVYRFWRINQAYSQSSESVVENHMMRFA